MHNELGQTVKSILKNTSILDLPVSTTHLVILGNSVFVMLFLITFQPFQLYRSDTFDLLSVAVLSGLYVYVVHSALIMLVKVRLNMTDSKKNEERKSKKAVGIEYIISICVIVTVSIGMFLTRATFAAVPFTLQNFLLFLLYGFLLAPILLIITRSFIVIRVLFVLSQNKSSKAEKTSSSNTPLDIESPQLPTTTIRIAGSAMNESVVINTEDFLFANAQGNYINITIENDGKLKNHMIRCTISSLEDQLKHVVSITRCHRSFLVNLKKVSSIFSINQSKRIKLLHTDLSVPLSRSSFTKVKEALSDNPVK